MGLKSEGMDTKGAEKLPQCPPGMCYEARKFWLETMEALVLAEHELVLARNIAIGLTELRRIQAEIKRLPSAVVRDRFGVDKLHPLFSLERDLRAQLRMDLKALPWPKQPKDAAQELFNKNGRIRKCK